MPQLSDAQREALRARAAGLREEISHLTSEREQAEHGLSRDMEDARLLDEIATLEAQRESAEARRDAATVTAEGAAELMAQAAAQMEAEAAAKALTPTLVPDKPLTTDKRNADKPAEGGSK